MTTPERAQGNSGRWYERTPDGKGWIPVKDEVNPTVVPSPGRAGKEQIVRGAVGLVGSAMDAGQYVGQEMYAKKQAMARRLGFDAPSPEPIDGQSYRDTFIDKTGIGPPTDFMGKVGESIGAALPMTAVTAGMAPAGSAMLSLKDNFIRDVAGSIASRYAEKKGVGPIGQAVAGVAAAILVPTRIPNRIASRFGKAEPAQTAASVTSAANPAAAVSQPVASATRRLTDSETIKIANQYKVKPDNVRAVADYLRDRISIDPATGKPKVEEFVAAIDEAERLFDGKTPPLLANAVGDVGGPNIIAVQKSVIDENAIASSRATGIRDAIVEDLSGRINKLVPRWETESALSDHATLEQSKLLRKTDAWDATPFNEIPTRTSAGVKSALEVIKSKQPLLYSKLPSETRAFIENLGDDMTLRDLQDLRADLGSIIEAGREFGVDPKYRTVIPAAINILRKVDSEIDAMPKEGTKLYREAVKATSDYYDLFDPKYRTTRAFTLYGDKEHIVSEVFKAKNPVDEIDNLTRVFGQTPDGMEKVQSIFMRDLIGERLGDKPIGPILRTLAKEGRSAFYEKLLGPEKYRDTVDILNGYRMGTAYDVGAAATALKTGSRVPQLKRLAAFLSSPVSTAKGAPDAIMDRVSSMDAQERVEMIESMIFDTTLAKRLALIPDAGASGKEVDRWVTSFEILSARGKARAALARSETVGRVTNNQLPAALRQAIGSGVVNQANGGGVQ